ncbi:MAG: methyltransferase domain-containing protein [Myxococcaceae bacterium]|jgi:tRNA1Val (adenine37-N6)-methyltransferase|nr:methyltransferase domain-containing protein [Myxococcaceae bacterium]MCA3013424.1 methyltransferase domain-containing protein [Myxococcaceae bacterium]
MSGLVRPARRPDGWTPPGPKPPGPRGRADLLPKDDEDLCYLSGDWRLFQKVKGHRWSLDDLVTAWTAVEHLDARRAAGPARALDLGCGLGSVLLMLAWRAPDLDVTGVEAQPERASMARRSIAFNGVEGRCRVLDGDLRTLALDAGFALVTGTPPYFPKGTGTEAAAEHVSACRFEHRGGVEAYLEAAARHLRDDGLFVMCAAKAEDQRVRAFRSPLQVRGLRHVVPREGKAPLLSIWRFSRQPGPLAEDTLVVRDASGQWTDAFRRVRRELGLPDAPPRR